MGAKWYETMEWCNAVFTCVKICLWYCSMYKVIHSRIYTHTHTHAHTHIYIYICTCLCIYNIIGLSDTVGSHVTTGSLPDQTSSTSS